MTNGVTVNISVVNHESAAAAAQAEPQQQEPQEPAEEPQQVSAGTVHGQLNRWQKLIYRAITNRQWSENGRARNYALNGLPKSVDGPAKGFGKHLGRWGYREINYQW